MIYKAGTDALSMPAILSIATRPGQSLRPYFRRPFEPRPRAGLTQSFLYSHLPFFFFFFFNVFLNNLLYVISYIKDNQLRNSHYRADNGIFIFGK